MGKELEQLEAIIAQTISSNTEPGQETKNGFIVVERYPEEMILGPNIRNRNDDFVEDLAENILSNGQIQECSGEILDDGTVRVWGGHHRFWALELINKWIEEYNTKHPEATAEKRKLRVRASMRPYSEAGALRLMISENLHEKMKPEEEAEVIFAIYSHYEREKVKSGEKHSIADFSRLIGFGEAKVGNAVKYVGLVAEVRELVEKEALLYSVATNIARVPEEKQLYVAERVIAFNLDRNRAETFIRQTLEEEKVVALFTGEQRKQLDKDNFRLAFRDAADWSAKEAAGYFERLIILLKTIPAPERVTMTETIRDILSEFVKSASYFKKELKGRAPQLLEQIEERAVEMALGERKVN